MKLTGTGSFQTFKFAATSLNGFFKGVGAPKYLSFRVKPFLQTTVFREFSLKPKKNVQHTPKHYPILRSRLTSRPKLKAIRAITIHGVSAT